MICFFQDLIAHDAPKRHKLSVHVLSTVENGNGKDENTTTDTPDGLSTPPPMGEVSKV